MSRERTTLEYSLLGLLDVEPRTGYGLRQAFETMPGKPFGSSPGAVYPALHRLRGARLVSAREDDTRPGRRAMVHRVTAAGRRALESWLRRPVDAAEVRDRGDELLLRFTLMGDVLTRRETVRFLVQYRDAVKEELARLRAVVRGPGRKGALHERMALRHRVESRAADVRWATAALRALRSR